VLLDGRTANAIGQTPPYPLNLHLNLEVEIPLRVILLWNDALL